MTETAVVRSGGPRGRRKTRQEKDAEAVLCFERRASGYTTWQIAQELGVSVGTVQTRIEAARLLILAPKVDAAREMSMRTLEAAKIKLLEDWALLKDSADQSNGVGRGKREHSPKFAEALVKIEDRIAKLHGMDRPMLIEASVVVTHEGGVDAEIAALVAELKLNDPVADTAAADEPSEEIDA